MKRCLILLIALVALLFSFSSCYYEYVPVEPEKPAREYIFTEEWYEEHKADTSYELGTKDELKLLRDLVNKGENFTGKAITLVDDIDLSGEEWVPIGDIDRKATEYKSFSGSFDGNGHTIKGLKVTGTGDKTAVGLFGVTKDIEIKNLTLEGEVKADDYGAGFIGYAKGLTKITNCTNNVRVDGASVGGFIGGASGADIELVDSFNNTSITATTKGGGIAAYTNGGSVTMKNVKNSGVISSPTSDKDGWVGGIVGLVSGGTYSVEAENNGTINGRFAGGIVGQLGTTLDGTSIKCTNTGDIKGSENAGGLVGRIDLPQGKTTIIDSENSGKVEGKVEGGIVGLLKDGSRYILFKNTKGGSEASLSDGAENRGGIIGKYLVATQVVEPTVIIEFNLDTSDEYSNVGTLGFFDFNPNNNTQYCVVNITGGKYYGVPGVSLKGNTKRTLTYNFSTGSTWIKTDGTETFTEDKSFIINE